MGFRGVGVVVLSGLALFGCSVDKNAEKYDELRYEQLQKARCDEMASFLSTPLISEEPEEYDSALKRCQDMKTLTFEEYKKLADHGRVSGNWDIYEVFPEKQQINTSK